MVVTATACLEAPMASKDKGGRSSKTAATRDLKQKRLDKKAKKTEKGNKPFPT
jgi:hypothetical protein